MTTFSRLGFTSQKNWLEQAKLLQKEIATLGESIQQMDNRPGFDSNPKVGQIQFSNQRLPSDLVSGELSGTARVSNGKVDELRLLNPAGESVVRYSSDEPTCLRGPTADGFMTVLEAPDGSLQVTRATRVDPTTTFNKLKYALKSTAKVAARSIGTTIPLIGLGVASATDLSGSSNPGYQATSILGNVVGTAALVGGIAASSPILLGAAGLSLLTAGVCAGVKAFKENPGDFKSAYYVSRSRQTGLP